MCCSRSWAGSSERAAGPWAGQTPSSRRSLGVQVVQQVVELALDVLDPRDVGQRHLAVRARVADHQGAAAQQPVDEVLLVGHVADPGERDVVAAPGDHAVPGDQPPGGDRVRRGQPDQDRPDEEPEDADRDDDPDDLVTMPSSICRLDERRRSPAAPPARRSGSSSALGCVRVSTTTDSPSFSRFLEMATDGSCHRSTGRTWTTSPALTAGAVRHDQPPARIDAGRACP